MKSVTADTTAMSRNKHVCSYDKQFWVTVWMHYKYLYCFQIFKLDNNTLQPSKLNSELTCLLVSHATILIWNSIFVFSAISTSRYLLTLILVKKVISTTVKKLIGFVETKRNNSCTFVLLLWKFNQSYLQSFICDFLF